MINNETLRLVCEYFDNIPNSILSNIKITTCEWEGWESHPVTREFFNIVMQMRLQKILDMSEIRSEEFKDEYFKLRGGNEALRDLVNTVNELLEKEKG